MLARTGNFDNLREHFDEECRTFSQAQLLFFSSEIALSSMSQPLHLDEGPVRLPHKLGEIENLSDLASS